MTLNPRVESLNPSPALTFFGKTLTTFATLHPGVNNYLGGVIITAGPSSLLVSLID